MVEAATWAAVSSPPKSESPTTSATACAVAASPVCADTSARERPRLTIEPSSGNWNDCTSALRFVGHVSSPSDTVSWPGMVIRTSTAFAPVLEPSWRRSGGGEGGADGKYRAGEDDDTDHDESG